MCFALINTMISWMFRLHDCYHIWTCTVRTFHWKWWCVWVGVSSHDTEPFPTHQCRVLHCLCCSCWTGGIPSSSNDFFHQGNLTRSLQPPKVGSYNFYPDSLPMTYDWLFAIDIVRPLVLAFRFHDVVVHLHSILPCKEWFILFIVAMEIVKSESVLICAFTWNTFWCKSTMYCIGGNSFPLLL